MNLWDGTKKTTGKTAVRRVYVVMKNEEMDMIGHLLRAVLRSPKFKDLYKANVHLIPKFDFNLPFGVREKIVACIAKNYRKMKSIHTELLSGVMQVNRLEKSTEKTFRLMLLNLKQSEGQQLFLSIERSSYNNSQHVVLIPRKRLGEEKDILYHIGFLLQRKHPDADIKKNLMRTQVRKMDDTVWDELEQRPKSKQEGYLAKFMEENSDDEWLQGRSDEELL